MRFILILFIPILMIGCVSSQSLIGHDESSVIHVLGKPNQRILEVVPQTMSASRFGASPAKLLPGESYIMLWYSNIRNQQWFVIITSEQTFQRIKHHTPTDAPADCVLEIIKYDKDLVF